MALPLPKLLYDVEKGGRVVTGMQGANALTKSNLENKFMPLETAIKAQNALAYSSRMGNMGNYLRMISQMPAAERQAYLADPVTGPAFRKMMEDYRQGINSPNSSGNIITPQMLSDAFGGQNTNPISALMSVLSGNQNKNPVANIPMQQSSNPMSNTEMGIPGSSSGYGDNSTASPKEVREIDEARNGPQEQEPTTGETGEVIPDEGTAYTPEMAESDKKIQDTVNKNYEAKTPEERSLYGSQILANNKMVGTQMKNRADAAVATAIFLQTHRDEIAKVMTDAAKYNQIYGRAKNWLEKFKEDQPEEYANYIRAKTSIIPYLANSIRFMEGMGISHEAQEDAKRQVSSIGDELDKSPVTAIKVWNGHVNDLVAAENSILTAAEPLHHEPSPRKTLAGIKELPKEYIPLKGIQDYTKKATSSKPVLKKDEWIVYDPKGKAIGIGTTEQTDKLLKDHKGYSRKKS